MCETTRLLAKPSDCEQLQTVFGTLELTRQHHAFTCLYDLLIAQAVLAKHKDRHAGTGGTFFDLTAT
jgi:hypothetical protein